MRRRPVHAPNNTGIVTVNQTGDNFVSPGIAVSTHKGPAMKTITLPKNIKAPALDIIKNALGAAGAQGMTIAQMRERLKVLDKVDAAKGGKIELEEAEYAMLKAAYNEALFLQVSPDLVAIADVIDKAS